LSAVFEWFAAHQRPKFEAFDVVCAAEFLRWSLRSKACTSYFYEERENMRKVLARSVLTLVVLVGLSAAASAAPVAIGQLEWNAFDGVGYFAVQNQTGLQSQPGFPVLDQLTFLDFSVDVTWDDTTPNSALAMGADFLDVLLDGYSWDTSLTPIGPTPYPVMAQLKGHVQTGLVDGFNILSADIFGPGGVGLLATLGTGANRLRDLETVILYVDADPVGAAVPEPATMFLVGSGLAGLVACRRRRAARA